MTTLPKMIEKIRSPIDIMTLFTREIDHVMSLTERIRASNQCAGLMSEDGSWFTPSASQNQPSYLYVVVFKPTNLNPEEVSLINLSDHGGFNKDDIISLLLALSSGTGSSSSSGPPEPRKFYFLESGPDDPLEKGIKWDLNHRPGDKSGPMAHFIAAIEDTIISQFADYVCAHVGKYGTPEEAKHYSALINAASPRWLKNFVSFKAWKMIKLKSQVMEALEDSGLITTPICYDLPVTQELLPVPKPGWKPDRGNISTNTAPAAAPKPGSSIPVLNVGTADEERHGLAKRKGVLLAGMGDLDFLPKKPRDTKETAELENKAQMEAQELSGSA